MKRAMWTIIVLCVLLTFSAPLIMTFAATPINKIWQATQDLHITAGFGGGDAALIGDSAYDYTSAVDMATAGYEAAQVFVKRNASSGSSDLTVSVFASLDGTNFDTGEYDSIVLPYSNTDANDTIFIRDVAQWRVAVKSGSAYDYSIQYRVFTWEH